MNMDKLPSTYIERLVKRGYSFDKIKEMTASEAFDEMCNWEGLIDWGPELRGWMQALKEAE